MTSECRIEYVFHPPHCLPSPTTGTAEDDTTQQMKRDYYRLHFASSLDDELTQSSSSSGGQRYEERDCERQEEEEEARYAPIHPSSASVWGIGQQQSCPPAMNVGVATSASTTHLPRDSDNAVSQEDMSRHRQPEALLEPSPLLTRAVVAAPNPMHHRYENIFDLGAMGEIGLTEEPCSSSHGNHDDNPGELKRVPSPCESISSSGYHSAFVASNLTMNLYANVDHRAAMAPQQAPVVYDLPMPSTSSSSHGSNSLSLHHSGSGQRVHGYVNQEVIELQKKWRLQRRLKLMPVKQMQDEEEEGDSEGHYGSFLKPPQTHSKPGIGESACSVVLFGRHLVHAGPQTQCTVWGIGMRTHIPHDWSSCAVAGAAGHIVWALWCASVRKVATTIPVYTYTSQMAHTGPCKNYS